MKEQNALPQFVRDQMAREQRAGAEMHPDADVLTAFCEGTLTEGERARVMEHVAVCGDCREVIFLSSPEAVEPVPVQTIPASKVNWWRRLMPAAAAVAAIVVVGSAILLNHSRVETSKANVAEAPPLDTYVQAPSVAPSVPAQRSATKVQSKALDEGDKKVAHKQDSVRADAGVVGGIVAEYRFETKATESPAVGVPLQQQITAPGAHGPIAPKGNATNYQNLAVTPAPAPPVVPTAAGKHGPVEPAGNASNYAYGIPGSARDATTVSKPTSAVRSEGMADSTRVRQAAPVPQKSYETVEVSGAAAAVSASDASALEKAKTAAVPTDELSRFDTLKLRTHWRISDTGQLQRRLGSYPWMPVLGDVKFRVVSVVGNEIWAGGANGALYHSANSGENWTKISVETHEAITQIQFRDSRSGWLKTESGATWETSDGGARWIKK